MARYYIGHDGKRSGPFPEEEIRRRIEDGSLRADDLCWREGMADWAPIGSVLSAASPAPRQPAAPGPQEPAAQGLPVDPVPGAGPIFLYIPIPRLIALSILSFGLYEAYWHYRNWRYVKERYQLNIRPFWRALFGYFFCYSLFRRIHDDGEARVIETPTFSCGALAAGWIILMIFSSAIDRIPGLGASIVAGITPSYLCLVPVQEYVNSVTRRADPGRRYYRWSPGHVICVVVGVVLWGLVLAVEFMR